VNLSGSDRLLVQTLRAILPADIVHLEEHDRDLATIRIGSTVLQAAWLSHGWPQELREVLTRHPSVELVVAPRLSPASRQIAVDAGVGWADATGGAELIKGSIVVSRTGTTQPAWKPPGWTKSVIATAEAVLSGTHATVDAAARATGLSTGGVASALSFLTGEGLLKSDASRGRNAARRVTDWSALLAAYAVATEARSSAVAVSVGVRWSDPLVEAGFVGQTWTSLGRRWAATGAMAAAILAPYQTEVAPLEMYLDADEASQLELAAREVGLRPIEGGRLVLRPFPLDATARLSSRHGNMFCAPWPRVFVDLRETGVRGEDAADHLRNAMLEEHVERTP
jgi:hypothetical protein